MRSLLPLVGLFAAAAAPQAGYTLPERIGALQRAATPAGLDPARYVAVGHYTDPALPGTLDLFVRDLGVTAAVDLAATSIALHKMTGVVGDGTPVASDAGCPGLVGRVDRGTIAGRTVNTVSLFDVQDGHNVKVRMSYFLPDGQAGFAPALDAVRRIVFHCTTDSPARPTI